MSQQLKISSLGRLFNLGMLYDSRTERLIPGWNVKSACQVNKTPNSSQQVISEDTLQNKFLSLNISGDLKLSVLCGLVEVDGAAKFFRDEKSSAKQCRVTLHYTTTSHFEQLTVDQLNNVEFPYDQDATHVVTGITYGADAFFVFDRTVSEDEKFKDIHQKMLATIQSIPTGAKYVEREDIDKLQCKFYGDLILPSTPSTFDEAVKVYKNLPKLLKGRGVPKLIYLTPLAKQRPLKSVSFDIIIEIEDILKHFNHTEIHVNDLLKHETCSKFSNIETQLLQLKNLLTQFKMNFLSNISKYLPRIRSGEIEEKKLSELISVLQEPPFCFKDIRKYLDGKEREINQLTQHLKILEKEPNIQFDFPDTTCNLSALKVNVNCEYIVCLGFNVTSETSPYITMLDCYLKNKKHMPPNDVEWYDDRSVVKELRKQITKFRDSAKENSSTNNAVYVATNFDEEIASEHPSLTLYVEGDPKPFNPLGKPGTPKGKPTNNSIELEWTAPEKGEVASYMVTCCPKGGSMTQTKETKDTSYMVTDLPLMNATLLPLMNMDSLLKVIQFKLQHKVLQV